MFPYEKTTVTSSPRKARGTDILGALNMFAKCLENRVRIRGKKNHGNIHSYLVGSCGLEMREVIISICQGFMVDYYLILITTLCKGNNHIPILQTK